MAGTPGRWRKRGIVVGVIAVAAGAVGLYLVASAGRAGTGPSASSVDELEADPPTRLCVDGARRHCRSAAEIEALLGAPELELEGAAPTPGGTQGAYVLSVESDGVELLAKWRPYRSELINDAAKELAAYEVQKLLLDPDDYVVPPTVAHCFEAGDVEDEVHVAQTALPGTRCVLGFLGYWLSGAIGVDEARRRGLHRGGEQGDRDPRLFDPRRFGAHAAYRRNVACLNVLMIAVNNGDLHADQFVMYPDTGHWFVIDSSIAFESWHNPTLLFVQDMSALQVPSVPAYLAERLRSIDRGAFESLAVLAEWTIGEDGRLVPAERGEEVVGAPDARVRTGSGRVQVGLTPAEIDGVWGRIAGLRRALERGSLGTF